MDKIWGGGSLWLLEGVEDCCKGKFKEPFRRLWNEGGRSYKFELRCNKSGRFLLCSVLFIEEKKVFLSFPRRKCSLRGLEDPCYKS